ncbi:uncharacterized protein LAESUDRAFT_758901 [Laetiporus sulphureus 93-53]|uniref:Uncharacterized protein n=1 Tax=Laetiporus sulphureus 93-53 TaxID=1314785 RepID=A0A165EI72_9APHY|nr:uncharacterized protein LAESUDRAFT_758901 [Laetiporus sulphureus 93-53]KZT07100.1 hypothetical protein LAESUDRAFT_758901 [Laetiporus sulphureus 93-53]
MPKSYSESIPEPLSPLFDNGLPLQNPYAEDYRYDNRYVDEQLAYPLRARSPADDRASRRFQSRDRSPSAGSSRITSGYSPTTARIHSPEPPTSRGPSFDSGPDVHTRRFSRPVDSPTNLRGSGPRNKWTTPLPPPLSIPGLPKRPDTIIPGHEVKQEDDTVTRLESMDSIASTPQEEYGPPRPSAYGQAVAHPGRFHRSDSVVSSYRVHRFSSGSDKKRRERRSTGSSVSPADAPQRHGEKQRPPSLPREWVPNAAYVRADSDMDMSAPSSPVEEVHKAGSAPGQDVLQDVTCSDKDAEDVSRTAGADVGQGQVIF